MSYALETKKRKFHRVLESLTKPTSTPEQPPKPSATTGGRGPTTAREAIKKARLSRGDGGSSDLSAARDSVLKVARPGTRASSVSSTARPTFVPWDRERFLERLETFRRVDRWSPKPSAVSEVVWAKRGWICTDVARVSCASGCGGSVVVKLPDELDELDGYDAEKVQERKEVREKLVEEYLKLLIEGHGETCPWRNKGCDATIHRLPLASADMAVSGLQKRYLNLVKMGDKLPEKASIQTPAPLDFDEILRAVPKGFTNPDKPAPEEQPEEHTEGQTEAQPETPKPDGEAQDNAPQQETTEPPVNEAAYALALFGWDTVSDGAAGLAGCGACFRRLGLWMYKPKDNGEVRVYDALGVAEEHMEYCPWVNGVAQSGNGKPNEKPETLRSGWEVLTQSLKLQHRRRIRSTTSMDTLRAGSETPSMADRPFGDEEIDTEAKKAGDREWWSKIRRMKEVLNVKTPRKSISSTK